MFIKLADGSEVEVNPEDVLNSAEIQTEVQKKLEAETKGLKDSKSQILNELKQAKEAAKLWEGYDHEQIETIMNRIQNDEETRLMSEGKLDEVLARRTESMKRDYEQRIQVTEAKLNEYDSTLKQKDEKLASLVIDGQIREAYVGLGFEPSAMQHILRQGRDVFKMDENGRAVPRDSEGNILFGKDGKSQMSATEWLEKLADEQKFLRPASSGAGASHSGRGAGFDASTATPRQKIAEGLRKRGIGA